MTIDLKKLFETDSNLDKKFVDALLKAIKNNALKEFDYLKYKQSLKSMSEMGMDETTSFKSAFATASTMGLTKTKLVKSAKHYRFVLSKEREHFAEALGNQMDKRVAKKKEEAIKLKDKIKDYERKIAQMKKEMDAFVTKIENVDGEIQLAKEKIETTKQNFTDTYDSFVDIIDNDINLINSYL